jgi:hypothetical protein
VYWEGDGTFLAKGGGVGLLDFTRMFKRKGGVK